MTLSTNYDSVYFHPSSNKAGRYATGSSIELMDSIMNGRIQNGFAIIRPPGHHAMHDEPNGYCYFNHAAVVARVAMEKYKLERILIVDWDGKILPIDIKAYTSFTIKIKLKLLILALKCITVKELSFSFTMIQGLLIL